MPELPEVEAVCRKLRRDAVGETIVMVRVERPAVTRPQVPTQLAVESTGAQILAVERRGKNILLRLSNQRTLRVHLRMTGNLVVIPDIRFRPALVRAWFELGSGKGLVFEDPRVLGKIHVYATADVGSLEGDVGVEPLSEAFTPALFRTLAAKSRQPSKLFLMDQRKVAGLGNIYAAEALFRARVHPEKPMQRLRTPVVDRLYEAIDGVLREAVESAASAYQMPGVASEGEWFPVKVYGREGEPCAVCGRRIKRIAQGGRSTYFCPGCQRK